MFASISDIKLELQNIGFAEIIYLKFIHFLIHMPAKRKLKYDIRQCFRNQ